MPNASKLTTPVAVDLPRIEARYADLGAPPGHLPLVAAGTRVVEFSPTDAPGETMAVVERNLAASGAGAR